MFNTTSIHYTTQILHQMNEINTLAHNDARTSSSVEENVLLRLAMIAKSK